MGPNKQQYIKHAKIYDRHRARPGLVALYDIRPGNGAGQFLQPRSLHGAFGIIKNNNNDNNNNNN